MVNEICKQIIKESNKYNITQHSLAIAHKAEILEKTDNFPKKISLSKRIIAIANNKDCKCVQCGKIHGDYTKEFCSNKCYQFNRKENASTEKEYSVKRAKRNGEERFADLKEGYDYQVCGICRTKTGDLGTHITMHNISAAEYRKKFNIKKLKPKKYCEMRKGENNPAYQHNGRLSAWSKNFVHGYDQERHKANKQRQSKFMKDYKDSVFKLSYWINYTNGDEELAKKLYTKSQTRSLDWFINRYGEIEGKARYRAKTEKWLKSRSYVNYSKISQELFNEVIKYVDCTHVYYATFNRADMKKYQNKEYFLRVENSFIRPDFIDLEKRKIIEFDGDYWHSPKIANPLREQMRDKKIVDAGYKVLHIPEYKYKQNKEQVIQECIKFLTQ